MGKKNLIQTDFLAGEISPRMEMQDNLEGRKHGVEFMKNFFTHLQGTAETSRGTEWIADTPETDARVFRFNATPDDKFMLVVGTEEVRPYNAGGVASAAFTSPWTTAEEIASLQAVMSPDEQAIYFTCPTVAPYQVTFSRTSPTITVWTLVLLTFVNPPAAWTGTDWPVAIAFFGSRMWLGGLLSDASLFWGSKVNDYLDFTLGTLADDAIEARLDRRGAIRWIAGGAGLLIGTENAEHVIYAEGGVIVPGDINSKIQSTNGSYATQALEVGSEILYVSPDGRKIRSTEYEWTKDAWRSRDLTYASEHITKDNEITHMAYAANPDSRVYGVTQVGEIVAATYDAYSQAVGFARRSTQGDIVDVAVAPSDGVDELWVLVDRGRGFLSLEKEGNPENTKLDSYTTFTSETLIAGGTAPQLALMTCQVVIDGAVHPDVIPDESGVFTTEYSGYVIQIGLKISSVIITLPVADTDKVGTTRTMKKRWTEVWVRILDSWRPKINGRRTPNRRVPTPMGEVEPARTESVEVATTGWDNEGKITIEQDLPLRTEIAGWFGRILQEET